MYGTPAVCPRAWAADSGKKGGKKRKTVKCGVTKAKQDNAGHMDTNTLTHTVGHECTLYTLVGFKKKQFVDESELLESEEVSNSHRKLDGVKMKSLTPNSKQI